MRSQSRRTVRRSTPSARGQGGIGNAASIQLPRRVLAGGQLFVRLSSRGAGSRPLRRGRPPRTQEGRTDCDRKTKTELAVRAPLVDGDFGKPVRILIPKAATGGRTLKVLARSNTQSATVSLALGGSMAALSPVMHYRNGRRKRSRRGRPASRDGDPRRCSGLRLSGGLRRAFW